MAKSQLVRYWLWRCVLNADKLLAISWPNGPNDVLNFVDELLVHLVVVEDDVDRQDAFLLELELDIFNLILELGERQGGESCCQLVNSIEQEDFLWILVLLSIDI